MKPFLAIVTLLLVSLGGVHAAGTDELLSESFMTPEGLIAHLHELGLSPEQEQKIRTIVSEAHVRIDSLSEVLREKQRQFDRLLQDPTTSTQAATQELGGVLEAEASMKMLVVSTFFDVRHQLTKEQLSKALEMAKAEVVKTVPFEKRMNGKAEKLRAAFRWLGNDPPEAFVQMGQELETLTKAGDNAKAEAVLDKMIEGVGLNESAAKDPVDFAHSDPGKTDLDSLIARFDAIKIKAKACSSAPALRKLLKVHEEFEMGRTLGDAARIGRALTQAEAALEITKP